MLIYILLNKARVSQDLFITMVQMLNPSFEVKPSEFVSNFLGGHAQTMEREYIPFSSNEELNEIIKEPIPMSKKPLKNIFQVVKAVKALKIIVNFMSV